MGILFPENIYCISCNEPISMKNPYSLCRSCYENIVFLKDKIISGDEVVRYLKNGDCIDDVYLATLYDDTMKNLIHAIKYSKKTYIAPYLAQMIFEVIDFNKIDFDYICSTPIHTKRLEERGYNQVDIIAKYLSKLTEKTVVSPAKRIVNTVSMYHLDKNQRTQKMKGAFVSDTIVQLEGKTLLVIDDILTTGSTMYNLSLAIKNKNKNTSIKCIFATRATQNNK